MNVSGAVHDDLAGSNYIPRYLLIGLNSSRNALNAAG